MKHYGNIMESMIAVFVTGSTRLIVCNVVIFTGDLVTRTVGAQ